MIFICPYRQKKDFIALFYLQTYIFQCLINLLRKNYPPVFSRTYINGKSKLIYYDACEYIYSFPFTKLLFFAASSGELNPQRLKEKAVSKKISDETTLNPKEAEMAIYQLPKVIIDGLLNGQTVQLGELGSFRLTVSGKGMESEEDVDANCVKQVNIRFMPSSSLKAALQKATFVVKDNI